MNLEEIKKKAIENVSSAKTTEELQNIRVAVMGRKGGLTEVLKSLKDLSIEEKKKIGATANELRDELEELFNAKEKELKKQEREAKFRIDVTRPGHKISRGNTHPLSIIDKEVRRIFSSMNFSVVEGPEIETEYYNFDALNIPAEHPARDMWDTFWLKNNQQFPISNFQFPNKSEIKKPKTKNQKLLMRTHTSPMQIRYMETRNPPFQIIVPGRVFRYEATDASHETNFYQVEGLMVGEDINLANFKFVVEEFFKKFFSAEDGFASDGEKIEFRYRPSYFPFVEPGLEVDIRIGKGKWLEVMGAGMVHRNVFDAVRYNPDRVQGFAFGMGLDRLAMIKYNIPDIRLFYSGDVRLTKQF